MAHTNLRERRRAIAELVAGGVTIDPVAARRLARKFRCSETAIRCDLRAVAAEARLSERLYSWRGSDFSVMTKT